MALTPMPRSSQASDGSFYGTAKEGGTNSCLYSGTLMTLYSFCSQSGCADGQEPGAIVPDDWVRFRVATGRLLVAIGTESERLLLRTSHG